MTEHPTSAVNLDNLPVTPTEHFKLFFYAAVLNVIRQFRRASENEATLFEEFPFLRWYADQLAARGLKLDDPDAPDAWLEAVVQWETRATVHLPLRAIREHAGLSPSAVVVWVGAGLAEEDTRFADLFRHLQNDEDATPCATLGFLNSWCSDGPVRALHALGLVNLTPSQAPRHLWTVQVPTGLWDAMQGEPLPAGDNRFEICPRPEEPIALEVPPDLAREIAGLPALLSGGEITALVVRGPQHNGRTTLLRELAQRDGRGALVLRKSPKPEDDRWQQFGTLATLLNALPIVVLDLGPNESFEVPRLAAYAGALGIVMGHLGGVTGPALEQAISIELPLPSPDVRRVLWDRWVPTASAEARQELAGKFRLATGHLCRLAALAAAQAAKAQRTVSSAADVQAAARLLNRQALDTIARRLATDGSWDELAVGEATRSELHTLEMRCRQREQLGATLGPVARFSSGAGVRALFSGPSGTGKTLAAKILAAQLRQDLYRIDLASVVNKYIGETEKNLDRIFSRAEELDVILLLDEGDALMTHRTAVQTSNDRYANLETNYLLQRLEAFEGIIIITTNAADRIDGAFARRMDIVVDFTPPDAGERRQLWQMHLPANHEVDPSFLEYVATRCTFTGGQIRNAVEYAGLQALEAGEAIGTEHVAAAVQREYRKSGAVSPLRPWSATSDEVVVGFSS